MSDDPTKPDDAAHEPTLPDQPVARPAAAVSWGCRPSLEELYKYMDGAMEPDRIAVVTSHLSDCSGCDDFFHFHSGLRQLIGSRCQSELPKDLPQRVFRAISDLP